MLLSTFVRRSAAATATTTTTTAAAAAAATTTTAATSARRLLSDMKTPMPAFDHEPSAYTGPPTDELWKMRKANMFPGIFSLYKNPIHVHEAKMQYVWDVSGRRYLDCIGGIVTISAGHCHPRVVAAGQEQMGKYMHATTLYMHEQVTSFCAELAAKMPGDLKHVYLVNSGAEANDLATLMCRAYTGNYDMISLRNCYHGLSAVMMGTVGLHTWRLPVPMNSGYHHAMCPDEYRGFFAGMPDATKKYVAELDDLIKRSTAGQVAGFIAEPIQGVGGTVVLPDGYLRDAYKTIRAVGGLCIADEVQTGFGRCGTHYWGFEAHGVMPDIVVMAKGIGNGTPLAAVVTTPEISQAMAQRVHFNTYGGNPVSSAIGRAVLRAIDEDGLQQNCLETGAYLMARYEELKERHAIVGDVRGQGLMTGVEFVEDRESKQPLAAERMGNLYEATKDYGVLVGKGGLNGNVLRIKPPMCITKSDVDYLAEALDLSIRKA